MNISISNAIQSSAISGGGEPSALPLALDLSITGGFAIGSVQTGNYTYFDPNGVAESGTTFKWYRVDGSTRTEVGTAQNYTLVAADEQKAIEFEVTPRNADPLVGPTASVQKNIPLFPVPPTATNVSFTGTLEVGQQMQGSYDYGDINGDPESGTTFKWWRADNAAGTLNRTEISGATSINYTLVSPADEGKYIQFQVTPRNDIGEVGSMSPSSWRGAVDSLPVASNVTYTGNNNVGELLSSSFDYSDANSDPEGTSLYQWLTSATSGGAGTPISGATSANYTVAATDEGNFLSVSVTPVTSSGVQGLSVSSGARSVAVGPLPGFSTNPSFTGILKKGDVLTGTYVYNSASATQGTSTFKWYNSVSGAISGATSLTYTLQASDIGDNISFGVTPVSVTGVQGTEFITPTQGPILDSDLVLDNLEMLLDFTESETLGREEVVNGDFATDSDWIKRNGSTINDVANVIANGDIGSTTNNWGLESLASVFQLDKTYRIKFRAKQVSLAGSNAGAFQLGYSYYPLFDQVITNEFVDYEFIATPSTYSSIRNLTIGGRIAGDVFQIDDISVKELTQSIPDSSGNNNVAELFTGKALEFDGSNDYVSANSFAGTLSTGDAFTFAIWFNSDKTGRFFQNILTAAGGTNQATNIFKIGVNPATSSEVIGSITYNTGGIYFDDSAAAYNNVVPISGGIDYNDGKWHRVVVSRPSGSGNQDLSFYVDGSSIGTAPCNPLWSNLTAFDFGQEWDGGGTSDHFEGKMSNIQVYDYAWTSDDVTYDYANPQNLVTDRSGASIVLSNLKGYWALSEGAGEVVYDSSGEGNNGTIIEAIYDNSQPRIPQLGMQNWSKGSNSLTFSEDFSNAAWIKGTGTSVTRGFTDPLGGSTAYKASYDGVGSQPYIFDDLNNTTNMRSVWARTVSGTGQIHLTSHNSNSNSLFNLTTVWQRVSAIPITGAGVANYYLVDFRGSSNLTEVLVWGAQIDDSTTLGGYRPTSGSSVPSTTLIPDPNTPTKDVYANPVRDRDASFNLDGIGYATIADSTSLNISNGTLQFWLKTTDTAFTILSGQSSSEFIGKANVTWFNGNAGTITVYKDNVTLSSNNTPDTDGNWHFYTFTGINVSSWTAFEISNLANFKLDGLLDSVFIYSDVLTSAEIIKNYNFTEPDHQ